MVYSGVALLASGQAFGAAWQTASILHAGLVYKLCFTFIFSVVLRQGRNGLTIHRDSTQTT